MTSGIYKVTWGGPGNIVWEKVGEAAQQTLNPQNTIAISSSVAAVSSTLAAGLSFVAVVQNAMILTRLSSIGKDVSSIKARFDLLFLDRSLDYFESAHRTIVGIDANIAEALKQDCLNALSQLVQDKNLVVPAFLRHRCLAFVSGVSQFSQLIYAMLHDGKVNALDRETINLWARGVSSLQGVSPDGGYVAQSELLLAWRDELAQRDSSKKTNSLVDRFSSKDSTLVDEACGPNNFARCSEVLSLYREIEAYVRYSELLTTKQRTDRTLILKLVG